VAIDRYHLNIIMGHSLPKVKQYYYQAGAAPLVYITDYLHSYYYAKKRGKGK